MISYLNGSSALRVNVTGSDVPSTVTLTRTPLGSISSSAMVIADGAMISRAASAGTLNNYKIIR